MRCDPQYIQNVQSLETWFAAAERTQAERRLPLRPTAASPAQGVLYSEGGTPSPLPSRGIDAKLGGPAQQLGMVHAGPNHSLPCGGVASG